MGFLDGMIQPIAVPACLHTAGRHDALQAAARAAAAVARQTRAAATASRGTGASDAAVRDPRKALTESEQQLSIGVCHCLVCHEVRIVCCRRRLLIFEAVQLVQLFIQPYDLSYGIWNLNRHVTCKVMELVGGMSASTLRHARARSAAPARCRRGGGLAQGL